MALLTDFKSCLRAIENGNFKNIDLNVFIQKFKNDPVSLGDHLQFALYKFCKETNNPQLDTVVVKLSMLCFTKESVSGFSNMCRFVGSLFHITDYLLKRNMYKEAIEISKAIEYKKNEIEMNSANTEQTRSILYGLHSYFIRAAEALAMRVKACDNEEINLTYELADVSLTFLQLIKQKQLETGKKIFRNFKSYFSSLRFYNKNNIYKLYRNLELVLMNLMPMYRENDFLLYYILKCLYHCVEMGVEELIQYFKVNLNAIMVLINESKAIKYWDLILSADFTNEKYFRNFIGAAKKIATQENGILLNIIFSIIFNRISQLWLQNLTDKWGEVISCRVVQKLYSEVLLVTRTILGNVTQHCRRVEYQLDICFSDVYAVNLLRIVHMIRLCVKHNLPGCLDLMNISCEAFKIIKQSLNEMKNECCGIQKNPCWNNFVIQYTNTIETVSRYPNCLTACNYLKICCEELLTELVNKEFELPYDSKRISVLFHRWHNACMKLGAYEEALFVSVFFALSYREEEGEAFLLWVKTKTSITSEVSDSRSIMLLTVKDIIDKEGERIKCMNPHCPSTGQILDSLLMKELAAYSSGFHVKNSQAFIKCVINLWEILKIFDLKLWEKASALNHVITAVVSSADSECLNKYQKECADVIDEIMKSRRKSCRGLVYAGNLKYALFLCHLKSVQEAEDRVDGSKSVLEYLKKEEEEKVKFGDDADLNLTCDIMPSSNHMTVAFEENYIKALNETLSLWEEAADMMESTSLEPTEFNDWLHNIRQLAQKYSLIGDVSQALVTWVFYYRVSKICNNRPSILLGLSHIIQQYSNLENCDILMEGENIANEILQSNNNNSREKDIVACYWLSLGLNYLRNRNEERCLIYLLKLKDIVDFVKMSLGSYIYHAKYWCLVSKFLCLYPWNMRKFDLKPDTELRTVVFQAFSYANNAVKSGSISALGSAEYSEALLTMLEVNIWSYHFFEVYYQAVFMRFFLDDLYQIFQKLVLPTRTAFILTLLAEVDVMCEKIDDGTTKLNSLKSILGTHTQHATEEEPVEPKSALLKVPPYSEEEKESPRVLSPARFLNLHDRVRERDPSPLRYVLKDVDIVKRFSHTPKCNCYTCRNLLIKYLYLNALAIEAQLQHMSGRAKMSCMCYKEGYKSLKKLQLYQSELNYKLLDRVSKDVPKLVGSLDFEYVLVKTNSIKFLYNYALFTLSVSVKQKEDMTEDVQKFLDKIDRIMMCLGLERKLLEGRVLELKLVSFEVSNMLRQREKEEMTVPKSPLIKSPKRMVVKTPFVPKNPKLNLAPNKYKQSKSARSPNLFVSKPSGRKIFTDDVDAETEEEAKKQKPPASTGRVTRRMAAETASKPKKRTAKKNILNLEDVELLS